MAGKRSSLSRRVVKRREEEGGKGCGKETLQCNLKSWKASIVHWAEELRGEEEEGGGGWEGCGKETLGCEANRRSVKEMQLWTEQKLGSSGVTSLLPDALHRFAQPQPMYMYQWRFGRVAIMVPLRQNEEEGIGQSSNTNYRQLWTQFDKIALRFEIKFIFFRYLFVSFLSSCVFACLCSLTVHLMSKNDMSVDLKLVPDNSSC